MHNDVYHTTLAQVFARAHHTILMPYMMSGWASVPLCFFVLTVSVCLSFTLLFSSHFYLHSDLNLFVHVVNAKANIPCVSAHRGVLLSGRIHSSHRLYEPKLFDDFHYSETLKSSSRRNPATKTRCPRALWCGTRRWDHRQSALFNTANMVAEQCRSRARTLAVRALLTRVCCVMKGRRNEEPIELMHEDFQVHVDSDLVGDLLGRMNTTGMIVRRSIEECVSMTSDNKITFETNCETNE